MESYFNMLESCWLVRKYFFLQISIVSVGLQQGSALSPFLFVLMDVLSEEIRNEELWEMLYADNLIITTWDPL